LTRIRILKNNTYHNYEQNIHEVGQVTSEIFQMNETHKPITMANENHDKDRMAEFVNYLKTELCVFKGI